ncbi:UPF0488 protein CG14286 [Periplaneta americana]|uniref:UPF0488 protein CG14286 n=1 Tax=Periplaneta americana TaxID=6978 RepID=UPI0037E7522E
MSKQRRKNVKQNTGKELAPPQLLNNTTEQNTDAEQLFDLELKWCIQQLQAILSSKVTAKQAQEATSSLNVLKSKTALVIKKRQVMRASFGDYRTKMAEEEKKISKAQEKVRIDASSPSSKSQFVKRSSVIDKTDHEVSQTSLGNDSEIHTQEKSQENFVYRKSDNNFRFNFTLPDT